MKLSELAYHVVKNVKYLEDEGFTYQSFVAGDYDADPDYSNAINNAFAPINEAIHRLSDLNKIRPCLVALGVPENNIVDITALQGQCKKITNVFYMADGGYVRVGFREFGSGFLHIRTILQKPLFVEFVRDIPLYGKADMEEDVDLANLGISDTACSYIVEYAQGKLQEPIAPELANLHVSRAEQYFSDLEEPHTLFAQESVENRYRM